MGLYLISGCCTKGTATGSIFHHYASLKVASTNQEACKEGYLFLQKSHPYAEGWDNFDMLAEEVTRADLEQLLCEAGT